VPDQPAQIRGPPHERAEYDGTGKAGSANPSWHFPLTENDERDKRQTAKHAHGNCRQLRGFLMLLDDPLRHSSELLDCLLCWLAGEIDSGGYKSNRHRESECEPRRYGLPKKDRGGKQEKSEQCSDYRDMVQKEMEVYDAHVGSGEVVLILWQAV
jgi:hypothetical protein